MTEDEMAKWKEDYGHLTQATMDTSANLRMSSCDAELELGRLFTSRKKGDYVWFILTDDSAGYPLQRLCILLCTPDTVLVEFHTAGGAVEAAILDAGCISYLEHLRMIGYRKLSSDEYLVLTRGDNHE